MKRTGTWEVTYTRPHGLNLAFAVLRAGLFIGVAVHLGWSWWLLALIVSAIELEFKT